MAGESLLIEPLDQLGNPIPEQSITLSGWALPKADQSKFSTKQRTKKTEYQGNPEATLQKFGPSFPDTMFSGEWHNRHITITGDGRSTPLVASDYKSGDVDPAGFAALAGSLKTGVPLPAFIPLTMGGFPATTVDTLTAGEVLQELFDDLARSGQDVQVTWANRVRRGVIKEADFTVKLREDLPWALTFEWYRDGSAQPPSIVITKPPLDTATTIAQHIQNLQDLLAIGQEVLAAPETALNVVSTALGTIENAGTDIQNSLVDVSYLPSIAQDVTTQSKRMIASLGGIVTAAQGVVSSFGSTPPDTTPAADDAGNLLIFEAWLRDVAHEMQQTSADAQTDQTQFQLTIEPLVLTTFRAKTDTDLRDVAIAYYGTPLKWHDIADFNGFTVSLVPAGTLIMIPRP